VHTQTLSRRVLPLFGGALLTLLTAPTATAQQGTANAQTMAPPPPGEDTQPPTVTITPTTNTDYTTASRAVTIAWCDNGSLQSLTRSVKLNGVSVSTGWTWGAKAGCESYATSSATVTLSPGNNALQASIQDSDNNLGSASVVYSYHTASAVYTVLVTPDGGSTTQPENSSRTFSFAVENQGNIDETYNLSVSCSGQLSQCSVAPSIRVGRGLSRTAVVSYVTGSGGTTGSITLTATASHRTTVQDAGSLSVINGWISYLTVNSDFSSNADRHAGLCDEACFAARYSYNTVPYFSLDQARSVTLTYDGEAVAVRPFIIADASIGSGAATVSYLTMEASIDGSAVTFLNGDRVIHFQRGANPMRLAGQFDASSYETGAYPLTITVKAIYADHVETKTVNTKLIVVNERKSYVARGWAFAGLQRIDFQTDGSVLILDGTGSASCTGSASYFACSSSGESCWPTSGIGLSVVDHSSLAASGTGTSRTYKRTYRDGTEVYFDNAGRMTFVDHPATPGIRYDYDASGRLSRIYDPVRVQPACTTCVGLPTYTVIGYATYGIASIVEPSANGTPNNGRATQFAVASDSTLRTITNPDGSSIALAYDSQRRLETETLSGSRLTRFVYDARTWKLTNTQFPTIPATHASGGIVPQTPMVVYQPWEPIGVPTGPTTYQTPAPAARADTIRAAVTDAGGHVTRFTVDWWGQPLVVTDPIGNVTTITRSNHLPVKIVHPTGAVDTLEWRNNRELIMTRRIGTPATFYSYGIFGRLDKVWGTGQPTQEIYLSATGLTDSTKVNGGNVTRFYHDEMGRDTMVVDPMGHATKSFYDEKFGNRDSTWATGDRFTRRVFDAFGRDSVLSSRDEPDGRLVYDVMNRITAAYDGVHASPTSIVYDPLERFVETTDPKGLVYRTNFNAIGWVESEKRPGEGNHRHLEYDIEGQVSKFTDRRTHNVSFRYDALHRLIWKQGSDGLTDNYGYSPNGLVRHGTNFYSIDSVFSRANGWTDSVVTYLWGQRFSRQYKPDANFRLAQFVIDTTPSLTFVVRDFTYDAAGMLGSVKLNGKSTLLRRNDDFQRDTTFWPGGVVRSEVYTAVHQLSRSTFSSPLGTLTRSYGYDPSNRIVELQRPATGGTEVRDFTYDGLGRLKTAERTNGQTRVCNDDPNGSTSKEAYGELCTWTGNITRDDEYFYDAVDNITRQKDWVSGVERVATIPAGTNALTGWGPISYAYDQEGNRIQRTDATGTTQYTWSSDGQLARVVKGSTQVDYLYNAFGQVVLKKVNGVNHTYFLWDGAHLLAELNGSATGRVAEYAYLPGVDNPFAIATGANADISYIAEDALGNVVGVFDTTGVVRQGLVYDEWGVAESVTGTLGDAGRLRWKGLVWEPGITQLYYMRNRWYDPEARRFISEDPIGLSGGVNLYGFGGGDPVNFSDPFGLDADPCIDNPEACVTLGTVTTTAPPAQSPWDPNGMNEWMNRPDPPMAPVGPAWAPNPDPRSRTGSAVSANRRSPVPTATAPNPQCQAAKISLAVSVTMDGLTLAGGIGIFARGLQAGRGAQIAARQAGAAIARRQIGIPTGANGGASLVHMGTAAGYQSSLRTAGAASRNHALIQTQAALSGAATGEGYGIMDALSAAVPIWSSISAYRTMRKVCGTN
jgi:RHS repeat-associated protein